MSGSEATPRRDGARRTELELPVDRYQGDGADPSEFAVVTVSANGEVVVAVRGDVDLATAPRLWRCIEEAMSETGNRLVVDLAETTFLDSTALGVFVQAFKRLRRSEGHLVIRAPNSSTRKVLAVTGLDRLMTIEG